MLEKVFLSILNFPYAFRQGVMSINMIVSITLLILLILLVRLIFGRMGNSRIICILYFLIPLRVIVGIIGGYSTTENTPECIVSVNHLINQFMTYILRKCESGTDTVQPVTYTIEALSLPVQIKWIWMIGTVGVLLVFLIVFLRNRRSNTKNQISLPFNGLRIIMVALFWFIPFIWLIAIYSKKDERCVQENLETKRNLDGQKRRKSCWIFMWIMTVLLAVTMFTSYPHIKYLDGEQTVKQFYYYLDQEYAGGLRRLYPMGEGDFKEGRRTDTVKRIIRLYDVTNDSGYRRYRGHTKDFAERKVIAVDVIRCSYEVSHGVGDEKRTKKETDVFEDVKRQNEGEWEIVYWSAGNWGYWRDF